MTKAVCPNCGFEPHPDEGPNCTRCNTPLVISGAKEESRESIRPTNYADPYSEKHESVTHLSLGDEDNLGSQSTAQLVEQQGLAGHEQFKTNKTPQNVTKNSTGTGSFSSSPVSETLNGQPLKKLSKSEISQIEQELYVADNLASDTEKLEVLRNMTGNQSAGMSQIDTMSQSVSPTDDNGVSKTSPPDAVHAEVRQKKPHMASHVSGVAYFARRLIQITGEQELHDGDCLLINDRKYSLKAKRLSSNLILGLAVSIGAILLLVLAIKFAPTSHQSTGTVIGIAVDQAGRPVQKQLTVRFPDLDIETVTALDGFFEATDIPAGSHTVEFLSNGKVIGQDFAAVASGEITTLVLRPTAPKNTIADKRNSSPVIIDKPQVEKQTKSPASTSQTKQKSKSRSGSNAVAKSSKRKTTSRKSKLILNANVEGARLKIDGKVLGAGNLTYKNISPGTHSYEISLSGYETSSGKIKLKSGKSSRLRVTLTPLQTKQQSAALEAERLIANGSNALQMGKFSDAESEFSDAIRIDPTNASAFLLRAETNNRMERTAEAFNDYIRAAEILQSEKKLTKANTAYSHAIETDSRSVKAYLGRGNLYLVRNEEIAAVADFETALRLDKRNASVYIGLGVARYKRGNYKKAIKHFKDARSLESSNSAAHIGLIRSYFKRDKIKDLRKAYDRFVKSVSATEVTRFRNDKKFAPILRIVDSGN